MRCMKDRFQTPCKQGHWPHTGYTVIITWEYSQVVWQVAVRQYCGTSLIPSIQFPSISACDGTTVVHSCSVSTSWWSLVKVAAAWLDALVDQRHLTWEDSPWGRGVSPQYNQDIWFCRLVLSSECVSYDCLNDTPDLSLPDTAIPGNAAGAEWRPA